MRCEIFARAVNVGKRFGDGTWTAFCSAGQSARRPLIGLERHEARFAESPRITAFATARSCRAVKNQDRWFPRHRCGRRNVKTCPNGKRLVVKRWETHVMKVVHPYTLGRANSIAQPWQGIRSYTFVIARPSETARSGRPILGEKLDH